MVALGLIAGSAYRLIDRPPTAEGAEIGAASQAGAIRTAPAAIVPSIAHPPCPSSVPVTLSGDPAMHLVSQVAADRLRTPQKDLGGACITLTVREQASSDAAAELSRPAGSSGTRPDLWLSSSPAWISLARSTPTGAALLLEPGPVFAVSPVVMAALSTSNLAALGGGWAGALNVSTAQSADQRQLALVDPTTSTAGLLTLLGLQQSAHSSGADGAKAAKALTALSRRLVVPTDDVSAIDAVVRGRLGAVSATEADVLASAARGTKLVAVQAGRDVPAAQYQVVPVGTPGVKEDLAERDPRAKVSVASRTTARRLVMRWFTSDQARALLENAHLRDSTGRMPTGTATSQLPTLAATAAPREITPEVISQTLREWRSAGRRGRVLMVLDISGSMAQKVPGTNPAATKLQLALEASRRTLASFAPDSELGLWTFSTRLEGSRDYQELVPVGPLSSTVRGATRRETLDTALTSIQARPRGDTGLYDTTLAAFRSMQRSYEDGRANAVLVLTDGRNDDAGSISRDDLLSRLRAEYDPARPVHLVMVGYGTDVDLDALKAIATATHGSASMASDPRDIDAVLLDALGTL